VQFFDTGNSPPSRCHYTGSSLNERVGVDEIHNLNVTIEGELESGSGHLCWDDSSQNLVIATAAACDQPLLAGGDPPTGNAATVTARRIVSLHQRNVTLEVVAW
jgi:hypothetical protein